MSEISAIAVKAFLSKAEAAPQGKDKRYDTTDAEVFFEAQIQPASRLSKQELSAHRKQQAGIFMAAVAQELDLPSSETAQGLVDQIVGEKPAVALALQRVATKSGLIAYRF